MKNIMYFCSTKQMAAMRKTKWLALIAMLLQVATNAIGQESIVEVNSILPNTTIIRSIDANKKNGLFW